jgi:hypothetical protein
METTIVVVAQEVLVATAMQVGTEMGMDQTDDRHPVCLHMIPIFSLQPSTFSKILPPGSRTLNFQLRTRRRCCMRISKRIFGKSSSYTLRILLITSTKTWGSR